MLLQTLGTSLTDRQILILNQFFDDIIICFDGDESGYKAALRAAENSIKELNLKNKYHFFFYQMEKILIVIQIRMVKNFIDFTKQAKISIHQFIFNHYKQQTDNNPSSMAIFEKKLRSIAGTIKDDFIKKYVLEFFLEKISSLTPHSNVGKKQFYIKKIKSLESTQKHFNESKSAKWCRT